jgi:N-acyl homoserine lactone hydrolase
VTSGGSKALRMLFVQFGAERVAAGLSMRGGDNRLGWEPLTGALVETEAGWLLLDTGMARAAHDDPANDESYAAAARVFASDVENLPAAHLNPTPPEGASWTWGLPGDPVLAALESVGLSPQDIALAAVSHLHLDHSGGIGPLTAHGVPVALQSQELQFADSGRVGLTDGFRSQDWQPYPVDWRLLDGDAELAPGVWALSTPGHTPGHMSYRVDLPETGTWILTADAADLAENVRTLTPPGSAQGEDEVGAEQQAIGSLQRLAAEAARHDARVVPGHDQVVVNAVRHPPGGHR